MAKPNLPSLGFFLIAGLFVGIAVYGILRGRSVAPYLAVGVIFFIIGIASRRKAGNPPDSPGA